MKKNKWKLFKTMLKVIGMGIIYLLIILLMLPFLLLGIIGMGAGSIAEIILKRSKDILTRKIDEIKAQLNINN